MYSEYNKTQQIDYDQFPKNYWYIIYLRKSRSDDPNETIEETLARHERLLWKLVDELKIDRDRILVFREVVSGETIAQRPEMIKVLDYVCKGKVKGVIAVDVQRLARGDTSDQGEIYKAFSINNTKIITPGKIIDLENEYDQEQFEFDLFLGRREYKMINRRMQRGRLISTEEGCYIGNIPPDGYDKVIINKKHTLKQNDRAPIIKLMKDMYLYQNMRTTEIAKCLNNLGYRTITGLKYTTSSVRDILKNITNAGYVHWEARKTVKTYRNGKIIKSRPVNKSFLYYKGLHEGIFTLEEYFMIQDKFKEWNPNSTAIAHSLKNPLAGIVYCSKCGKPMIRRPYGEKNKEDTLYCRTDGCNNISTKLSLVEDRIIKTIENYFSDYKTYIEDFKRYEQEKENVNSLLENCKKSIASLNKQKMKACDFFEQGIYTSDLYFTRCKIIDNKLSVLLKQMEELEKEKLENDSTNENITQIPKLKSAIKEYWNFTVEEKNKVLLSIIKSCDYEKNVKATKKNPELAEKFSLDIIFKI